MELDHHLAYQRSLIEDLAGSHKKYSKRFQTMTSEVQAQSVQSKTSENEVYRRVLAAIQPNVDQPAWETSQSSLQRVYVLPENIPEDHTEGTAKSKYEYCSSSKEIDLGNTARVGSTESPYSRLSAKTIATETLLEPTSRDTEYTLFLRHQRTISRSQEKSVCHRCGAGFTRESARDGHLAHNKCKTQATAIAQQGTSQRHEKQLASPILLGDNSRSSGAHLSRNSTFGYQSSDSSLSPDVNIQELERGVADTLKFDETPVETTGSEITASGDIVDRLLALWTLSSA